jgi:hypothetical protein
MPVLALIIVFIIIIIGVIYANHENDTPVVSTPVVSTPTVSTPVVSTPTVSTPTVSTPAVSEPIRPTSSIVDGLDFNCPEGYYFSGSKSYQKCIKEGSAETSPDYTCPYGWNKLTDRPYCTFVVSSSGDMIATTTTVMDPVPPITDQSSTPALDTINNQPIPEPASVPTPAPVIDPFGLCPFGSCTLFDSAGNCIQTYLGSYKCRTTNINNSYTIGGKQYFETDQTPITHNAVKMCYTDQNGKLLQRNGNYICRFVKGSYTSSGKSTNDLEIYPEDMVTNLSVQSVNDIPIPLTKIIHVSRTSPYLSDGFILGSSPPTGYRLMTGFYACTNEKLFRYVGTKSTVDLYYVYKKSLSDGSVIFNLQYIQWTKPTTDNYTLPAPNTSLGTLYFKFALSPTRTRKFCVNRKNISVGTVLNIYPATSTNCNSSSIMV